MTVLVIGGAGGVGEGVVQTLLGTGATVVVAGRSRARLDDLSVRSADARLATETLDALDPALADRAAELAGRHGALDGVVVSVASWGDQGRKAALSLTDDEWNNLLASNLTAVFRLYRAFVPYMTPGGALVQLNGMSADLPFPGGAGVALSAAARKSLTRTVAAELSGRGPRVYGVILGMVRTRPRQAAGIDDPGWIPASDVGWHVAELVAGTSHLVPDDLHNFVDAAAGPRSGTGR
jgi:NAD(P)-dependent dehydrogenase (short-subunit alcohol dehydrogenase family)